MKKVVVIPISH